MSSHPRLQNKWVIEGQEKGLDEYKFIQGPIPAVGDYGVLVRLHAASLNHRDHIIPRVKLYLDIEVA